MQNKEEKKWFYQAAGKGQLYLQEAPVEKDKKMMQSYFPEKIGDIQKQIEAFCDLLDYDGSFIYDEHPDIREINRVCQKILKKIGKKEVGIEEFIKVLFCQELHCRRCRRNRGGRYF